MNIRNNFTASLHTHVKSIFDAQIGAEALCSRIKELGGKGCAITDHGVVSSIEDYREVFKKHDLKLIPGVEMYVDGGVLGRKHLILLAKNDNGWAGVGKIVTKANETMQGTFPVIPEDVLLDMAKSYKGDIIATSACMYGVINAVYLSNKAVQKSIDKIEKQQEKYLSPSSPDVKIAEEKISVQQELLDKAIIIRDETKKCAEQKFTQREKTVAKLEKAGDESAAAARKELEDDKILAQKAKEDLAARKQDAETAKKQLSEATKALKKLSESIDKYMELEAEKDALKASLKSEETLDFEAEELVKRYLEVFGDDFYIELQNHGIKDEAWAAYKNSGNGVYLEFADGTAYFDDGSKYYFKAGSNYHRRYHAVCDVIHQLFVNTELKDLLEKQKAVYAAEGKADNGILLNFCDSYYYYYVANGNNYPEDRDMDATLEEELKAAFRSGEFTKLTSFFGESMGKSQFDGAIAAAKKEKKASKKAANFIKDCKDGKYFVSYEWPEKLKGFIKKPEYLDTFEPTPEFEEIVKKIKFRADRILERMDMGLTGADAIGKDALNILLLGKPGTGKTALAYALSAATGMPVCSTPWNKHSEEGEVEGKSRIVDGKPQFVETDALLFHQFGGIDINEEINLADPSVTMGCLGQKLEFPFIVKKNGFETVVRHPLNVIIGTMNVGTNGSNPLNQALANRFNTPYILDDPTRETFINILEKTSKKSREVCTWVYEAYEATVDYLKSPDVNEDDICQKP